jgi:hypothetical protein
MPAYPSPTEIQALQEILGGHFGLAKADNLSALFSSTAPMPAAAESRRYLLRSIASPIHARVAQRLDLQADALIVDPQLGTIGILHLLPTPNPAQCGNDPTRTVAFLSKTIARRIGEAAYLRHLLLEELRPGEPQHGRAPYSVEVVFILADTSFSHQLGSELRHIMREVALLHAVGVSLVEDLPAASKRPSQLMRGFSWLLHDTRQWLAAQITSARATPAKPTAPAQPDVTGTKPNGPLADLPKTGFLTRSPGFRLTRRGPFGPAPAPTHPGPPTEIRLKHFRLGGYRRWLLCPQRMLHVVHGPNGSGKSSFVEALELITTGCIDRLASEDHRAVITNSAIQKDRHSAARKPAASVMLHFSANATSAAAAASSETKPSTYSFTWRLAKDGVASPLVAKDTLRPGAFRLNQDIVDLLARSDSKARAHLLLTFFPDSYTFLSRSKALTTERDQCLTKLPARLRSAFQNDTGVYDESRAESALDWVKDTAIPWDRVPALLALDSTQITGLLPLLPLTFESNYRRTGTATSWEPVLNTARQLDDDLRALLVQSTTLATCLRSAHTFLKAYQDASAVGTDDSDAQLPDRLRRWLDLLASTDIHQREHFILSALEQNHPNLNPSGPPEFPEHITPVLAQARMASLPPPLELREAQLLDLRTKRDEAQRSLAKFRPESVEARPALGNLPALSSFDLGALDTLAQAGALGRDFVDATPRLSQAIREAFRDGKAVTIRQGDRMVFHVGEPGSLRGLLARVERVLNSLQSLEAVRDELGPSHGLVGTLEQFRTLRRLVTELRAVKQAAAAEFTQRLETPLGAALNEFTAMLTPARWAYGDIVSRVERAAAEPSFGFVQRGAGDTTVPAPLRLNTAQISAFALSFFLLCHRAREHPLRLGILDDPFENMDELTVTTVARGLGRYLRLRAHLGDGADRWQLILFLHGEQNVDRVRREASCATYFLPWLSPDAQLGAEPVIRAEPSEILSETLQDLSQIISDPRSGMAAPSRPLTP